MITTLINRMTGLEPARIKRILRFLIVGSSVNLLMVIAIIIMKGLGLSYDLGLLVTNITGLCINYGLNRAFVFHSTENAWKTGSLFALVYASVYLLQLLIYRLIFSTGLLHEWLAIIITIGLSAIYAYFMLEKVVFRNRENLNSKLIE